MPSLAFFPFCWFERSRPRFGTFPYPAPVEGVLRGMFPLVRIAHGDLPCLTFFKGTLREDIAPPSPSPPLLFSPCLFFFESAFASRCCGFFFLGLSPFFSQISCVAAHGIVGFSPPPSPFLFSNARPQRFRCGRRWTLVFCVSEKGFFFLPPSCTVFSRGEDELGTPPFTAITGRPFFYACSIPECKRLTFFCIIEAPFLFPQYCLKMPGLSAPRKITQWYLLFFFLSSFFPLTVCAGGFFFSAYMRLEGGFLSQDTLWKWFLPCMVKLFPLTMKGRRRAFERNSSFFLFSCRELPK